MRPIAAAAFRHALSTYPTGVTIVTGLNDEGWPIGMTIGTFTAASLDPPLVGFLPAKTSGTWKQIARTGSFCVNVLRHDQASLCERFSRLPEHRFDGLEWHGSPGGSPIIDRCLAWVDCTVESVADAGDHWWVMGRVRALDAKDGIPLVFFGGTLDTVRQAADR
jgi:3-hydroxy-9,10-secoandrosta-1,3,5(10)-triene-9,17-dione monooxygenase reductase component